MKEVLTKKFWQDVKKTFDEAREGKPASRGVLDQAASPDFKSTTLQPEQTRASSEEPGKGS
ncbi:MAG: hypothetical protein M3Y27_30740 [Acidobacteriota bacterium]|nr:hypothetical protein [Acidobacteriota bacterium]